MDLNYAGIDFVHGPDPTPSTSQAVFAAGHVPRHRQAGLHAGRPLHRGREGLHLSSSQSGRHAAFAADRLPVRADAAAECGAGGPRRQPRVTSESDQFDWRVVRGLPVDRRRHDLPAGVDRLQGRRHQSAAVLREPGVAVRSGNADDLRIGLQDPTSRTTAFASNVAAFFNQYEDIILR